MYYPDKELYKSSLINAMLRFNLTTASIAFMWPFVHCLGLKRNELFTEEGKICKRLGFLVSGIMIGIGDNIKGEKNVSEMYNDNDNRAMTSFLSLDRQIKSTESIMAVSESVILYITYDNLKYLCKMHPEFGIVRELLHAEQHIIMLTREADVKQLNPEEIVKKLYKVHPEYFRKPYYKNLISFYLGISRASYNSILKRLKIK